jgi:hypothetical protein
MKVGITRNVMPTKCDLLLSLFFKKINSGCEKGAMPMPEISRFFGMVIAMFYNDHAPPHFHVRYAGQKAVVGINPVALLEGKLSPKARSLVYEWAELHQEELMADWALARQQAPLNKIVPLE